jgi:hypothetical protein
LTICLEAEVSVELPSTVPDPGSPRQSAAVPASSRLHTIRWLTGGEDDGKDSNAAAHGMESARLPCNPAFRRWQAPDARLTSTSLGGDGGIRTPVQNRRLLASYVCSRCLVFQPILPPTGYRLVSRTNLDGYAPADFTIASHLGDARIRLRQEEIRANALSRGRVT